MNYDAWFDYVRLVETEGDEEVIRETYERAIANVPPSKGKLSKNLFDTNYILKFWI